MMVLEMQLKHVSLCLRFAAALFTLWALGVIAKPGFTGINISKIKHYLHAQRDSRAYSDVHQEEKVSCDLLTC